MDDDGIIERCTGLVFREKELKVAPFRKKDGKTRDDC
jgi:hypothetical protein